MLAEVAAAGLHDVDLAVEAAGRAQKSVWGPMTGAERAKYLYRIARIIQERSRELAVLESLDNGKPIRESRDVDVPWRRRTSSTTPAGRTSSATPASVPTRARSASPARSSPGTSHSMMAAWKLAPALAAGNTCVLKPADDHAADGAAAGRDHPAGRPAARGRQRRHRAPARSPARPLSPTREWTRWPSPARPRSARTSSAPSPARASTSPWSSAARRPTSSSRTPRRPGGRGHRQRHLLQPGRGLLRRFAAFGAGVGRRPVVERLKRRLATLRVGDPLDKNTDLGAINYAAQLEKIRELADAGRGRGCGAWSPACTLPARGLLVPADGVHRRVPGAPHRPGGDLRAGLSVLTFRTPEEAVAKANNTVYGLSAGVWTEKGSRIFWMAGQLRAGVVWANSFNRFDPASPFGGYRESGFGREGGRQGLAAYLDV